MDTSFDTDYGWPSSDLEERTQPSQSTNYMTDDDSDYNEIVVEESATAAREDRLGSNGFTLEPAERNENHPFLRLPPELMCMIGSYLAYAPKLALKLSCQTFYLDERIDGMFTVDAQGDYVYDKDDLLAIEMWECYNGLASRIGDELRGKTWEEVRAFEKRQKSDQKLLPRHGQDWYACSSCLRIRDVINFDNDALIFYGKHTGVAMHRRRYRTCVSCQSLPRLRKILLSAIIEYGGDPAFGGGRAMHCNICRALTKVEDDLPARVECSKCGETTLIEVEELPPSD